MKLFFPDGQHGQVMLSPGRTRIGSSPDCEVVLAAPGVAAVHVELLLQDAVLRVATQHAPLSINGRAADPGVELRGGDLLNIAGISCRVVAVERAAVAPAPSSRAAPVADDGRTKVRAALPRMILRGVSGATFGKTFPVTRELVIGRSSECDISVPTEEISRRHARVKPTPDGLLVEDLGSSNGTFINDRRIQREGLLQPGDELRLDAVRFMLVAPGMEVQAVARKTKAADATPRPRTWLWVSVGGLVVAIAVLLAALLMR